ncbi:uncharacterized protein UTRI_02616 [Ustilago trichophora]|uniref:SURP motif domain-containing protein n=1 Tax=Ustilago trichophora TaxID=86804 RepID=A0A5C3ERU3_9BASI|nr:uncharacterized protein UTRI_02616 [Ustilago trichophora]
MSRPPSKRRRFTQETVEDDSLSSHIFASCSSSQPSISGILRPCSFEISLNHDSELKRSLHLLQASQPSAETSSAWGSRLVEWTSSSNQHRIISDRYDAVHLLTDLPKESISNNPKSVAETDEDAGWSDLDSDSEDLFYMTPLEVSSFLHNKAKAKLDAQHSLRLANLASPSPSPSSSSASPPATSGPSSESKAARLEKSQFELMSKTARILSKSSNPAILELKILANHGGDARFRFLHKDQDPRWKDVWEVLQKRKGEMGYEEALLVHSRRNQDDTKDPNKQSGSGLVAYEDSDSSSSSEATASDKVNTKPPEEKPETDDKAKLQKQAERLARAKEWLKTRSQPPPPPPPPS